MIYTTGAWQFGTPNGIAVPEATISLDMLSGVSSDEYRGLMGQSDDGGNPVMPFEPDGGIGDGAGPIPVDGPIPVEADGGIGDGAGPIPADEGDGEVTILPYPYPVDSDDGDEEGGDEATDRGQDDSPIPVEPDGGIGDGAGPPPELEPGEGDTIDGGGEGTKADDVFIATDEADTFIFRDGHGEDTIIGFDLAEDRLDFTDSETDFTDLEGLLAHATDDVDSVDGSIVLGVYIETGEGTGVYLDGVSSADLASALIDF